VLFDLHGRRRRLVQVTYLTLAILMGGGLVLFGIGSDVQGGLADFFTGSDGDGSDSDLVEDQLEEAEQQLVANPNDQQALADVARLNYQLATTSDPEARAVGAIFDQDAQPRLEAASDAWQSYLGSDPDRPDDALAFLMVQVYGEQGLNQPEQAADAAEVVAAERRDPQAYLTLAQYAALAGDDRQAELAGQRAVDLAPKPQRDQVERQVDALLEAVSKLERRGAEGAGGGE
jgi:tetratricopeptide (TPR) repeat protein